MVDAPWRCDASPKLARPARSDAHVVDAAVLVEARVLGREHRVLHDLRDLRDRHEVAPLLAEFAEQHAVGREDAHRQLRPVVGEAVDLGQVGIGDRQRDAGDEHHGDARADAARPSSVRTIATSTRSQVGQRVRIGGAVGGSRSAGCSESLTRVQSRRSHYRNPCFAARFSERSHGRISDAMDSSKRVAR